MLRRPTCSGRMTPGHGVASAVFCVLLLASAICTAAPARADETAIDFIEPNVTRLLFVELTKPLQLNRDQDLIVQFLYKDYIAAIEKIIKQTDELAEEAGRSTIEQALAGRSRVTPQELRELRAKVLGVYRNAWPHVDKAMDDLILGLEAMLMQEQRAAFERGMMRLRRAVWLQPRQRAQSTYDYAGDGVDMLTLLDEVSAENGALAGFGVDAVALEVERFAQQLDLLLRESGAAMRDARMDMRIARALRDTERQAEAAATAMNHWRQLYELNGTFASIIARAAEQQLGEDAAETWNQLYLHTCFTWMYEDRRPDRQYRWLGRKQLTANQRQAVDETYAQYNTRFHALAQEAIELMIHSRIQHSMPLHAMIDPTQLTTPAMRDLYEKLLKNSGQMSALDDATSDAFESALDEELRRQFRRAVR